MNFIVEKAITFENNNSDEGISGIRIYDFDRV